jgi:hypothetical protein
VRARLSGAAFLKLEGNVVVGTVEISAFAVIVIGFAIVTGWEALSMPMTDGINTLAYDWFDFGDVECQSEPWFSSKKSGSFG